MKYKKLLAITIMLSAVNILVSTPTYAEDTYDVEFTIKESITLTLSKNNINMSLGVNEFKSDYLTVNTETNNPYGLTVFFNASKGHTDLRSTGTSTQKFQSITAPTVQANFQGGTWGYLVSGTSYNAIPLTATQIIDAPNAGTNQANFTIGAKSTAAMDSGNYSNELLFTAVANPDDRTAKAILTNDGVLTFEYSRFNYNPGDYYINVTGPASVVETYDVPVAGCADESKCGWHTASYYIVNVDPSFKKWKIWSYEKFFAYNGETYYYNLGNLNTSISKNMSGMFAYNTIEDWSGIGQLDMSNTENMSWMFTGTHCVNPESMTNNLSRWNTSNAVNMKSMFKDSTIVTTNVDDDLIGVYWDTRAVTDMSYMFSNVEVQGPNIVIKLGSQGLDSVTDMSHLFDGLHTTVGLTNTNAFIEISIGKNVGRVEDMSYMFSNIFNAQARSNNNGMPTPYHYIVIAGFGDTNTESLKNMSHMFYASLINASGFNTNVSSLNTSSVTDMSQMFASVYGSTSNVTNFMPFTIYMNDLNTEKVTNHSGFFSFSSTKLIEPNWAN